MRWVVLGLVAMRTFTVGCECSRSNAIFSDAGEADASMPQTDAGSFTVDSGIQGDAGVADGGSLFDGGAPVDAGTCDAGGACVTNPGAPCRSGAITCGAIPTCDDTGPVLVGSPCGSGLVCSSTGACVACVDGSACVSPSTPCQVGVLSCSSGAPMCNASAPLDAGANCGVDLVCDGLGSCVSCAANQPCLNSTTSCLAGHTQCGTGSSVCVDDSLRDAGAVCGLNNVCDSTGACIACSDGLACGTNPSQCWRGTTNCSTGAQQCIDSSVAVDAGASCAMATGVCSGTGSCVPCVVGAGCSTNPENECSNGTTQCSTGAAVCLDGTPKPNQTLCTGTRANEVCINGSCQPCTTLNDCPSGLNCQGGVCEPPLASCLRVKTAAPTSTNGIYWIDSDGDAGRAPFQVFCEMTIADGGWTLVTTLTTPNPITEVPFGTLITPSSPNQTYRDMRLPEASELLIVQDGNDVGFETSFDKQELIRGVTGLPITWAQMMDAMNRAASHSWASFSTSGFLFDVTRLNTTGCLQTGLMSQPYGAGNHGSFNLTTGPSMANSVGTLWWHWAGQGWTAGTGVFTGPPGGWLICNSVQRDFASFSNTVYLR